MSRAHRLLITGIPGTGKTSLGNYMRDHHGFIHLDFEPDSAASFLNSHEAILDDNPPKVVATWGFRPGPDLPRVLEIRDHFNFKWFWFDGVRVHALMHFNRRATHPESEFHLQIKNIQEAGLLESINAIRLNPFRPDGEFRPKDEIIGDLLSPQ